jgi:hypothetical protein
MQTLKFMIMALCLALLPALQATGQPTNPGGEFLADDFSSEVPRVYWNILNNHADVLKITQDKGVVHMKGSGNLGFFGSYELISPIPPGDFWVSLEVKMGKGNQGNAHLGLCNRRRSQDEARRDVHIFYDGENNRWSAVTDDPRVDGAGRFKSLDQGVTKTAFGDETKNFHNLKMEYQQSGGIVKVYLDGLFLGEAKLDWDLSEGFYVRFWTWARENAPRKVNVYFDNFRSNIPMAQIK